MAIAVKRKAELTLVALLSEALPDLNFYPSQGGDEDGGQTLPRPPFGAIWIDSAEKTISYNKTWMLGGTVVWVTRIETDDIAEHSDAVNQIYDAMLNIGSGVDPDRSLIVHGLDVAITDEFTDGDRQAHGDTISFTMGVSEFD